MSLTQMKIAVAETEICKLRARMAACRSFILNDKLQIEAKLLEAEIQELEMFMAKNMHKLVTFQMNDCSESVKSKYRMKIEEVLRGRKLS